MYIVQNQEAAGSAYATPTAEDLAFSENPAGLPWGSVPIGQIIVAGKAKYEKAQQALREGSASAA